MTTAQYIIGSFGLSTGACRLVANHVQTPRLSKSSCIGIGAAVGALTAGGHARMTRDRGVWALVQESVDVVWNRAMGAEGD